MSQKIQKNKRLKHQAKTNKIITPLQILLVSMVIIGIALAAYLWFKNPTASIFTIIFTVAALIFTFIQIIPIIFPKDEAKQPAASIPIHIHVSAPSSSSTHHPQSTTPVAPNKSISNIPYTHNPCFIGRDAILDSLHQTFVSHTDARPMQALVGLSGIGKTQTAVEYAYRYKHEYSALFWVVASSPENVAKEYNDIAQVLNLPEKDEQDEDIVVRAVKRWFENETGWLLIFDNADDPAFLSSYFPTRGNGHILITTLSQILDNMTQIIPLPDLGSEDAATLLLRRSAIIAKDTSFHDAPPQLQIEATAIANRVQGLPLALDQAGAFIQSTQCSLTGYLQMYQTSQDQLLRDRGISQMHPDPVATTWSISIQKVQQTNKLAIDILKLCAFLAANNIPEELFLHGPANNTKTAKTALSSAINHPYQFNRALQILLQYSLISRDPQNMMLFIHPLVQRVQRKNMKSKEQLEWAQRTIQWINHQFPNGDVITWTRCQIYLSHALHCAEQIETWNILTPQSASLLAKVGYYLQERAQYKQAESLYQRALAIAEQALGSDHPSTASILNNLAGLYQTQGKYDLAELLYQRALAIAEQTLGSDHPETATTLDNLAGLYQTQGKYDLAELLYQRTLAIREQTLGSDHPETATTLDNLALLYRIQSKYDLAEPLFQRARAITEQTLGSDHPETAAALDNLAGLYLAQGKYDLAEPLYQRALAIREQTLGSDHPETATTYNNLAGLYLAQGKYDLAEPLFQRARAIDEQALGSNHPSTATILNNLALLYRDQGKYDLAEPLYQRALAIREQTLGSDHPETATTLNNLAGLYRDQGKYDLAEPLFQRARAIAEQALGSNHPATATILNNLAGLYRDQGKYDLAEPLFQRARAIAEQALGSNHPSTAAALDSLALLYRARGKYDLAEPLFQRACAITEQALGPGHPSTAAALDNLAGLYRDQGKYDLAEPLFQRALAIAEQALGSNHPATATILNNLAGLYQTQGKYDLAEPLFQRYQDINQKNFGQHP